MLGTKFTWPDYGPKLSNVYLKPAKEAHWKKWIALYNEKMLSKGNFLDLYVYGYDAPEAYAIEKGGNMFYAFYTANQPAHSSQQETSEEIWKGKVELRGLAAGKNYTVRDYVDGKDYGIVEGPTAELNVEFTKHLLLEAAPTAAPPKP